MDDTPRYGYRTDPHAAPPCPRHPHEQSVSYCKRCNRPTCMTCTLPTEVGTICVDCSNSRVTRLARPSLGAPITMILIGLNVAVHLLGYLTPEIYNWGAFFPPLAYSQPWRFLTSGFIHAGVMHLLFNMLALWWTGQGLEPVMGKARFLALYLLAELGGSTFVLLWTLVSPDSFLQVTVGASGAVFGLFGAVYALQKATGMDTRSITGLLAINFLYGFIIPNVSWQGHLGGLLIGATAAYVMLKLDRPQAGMTAQQQNLRTGAALAAMGVCLVAIQYGLYSYYLFG